MAAHRAQIMMIATLLLFILFVFGRPRPTLSAPIGLSSTQFKSRISISSNINHQISTNNRILIRVKRKGGGRAGGGRSGGGKTGSRAAAGGGRGFRPGSHARPSPRPSLTELILTTIFVIVAHVT